MFSPSHPRQQPRQRGAAPGLPRGHVSDPLERHRHTSKIAASTGPHPAASARVTMAGSPVPPASVATSEPVAAVASRQASAAAPVGGAVASGITAPRPRDEPADLDPSRAMVVGRSLVFTDMARNIRLGGKLHQACSAASDFGYATVVAKLAGVRYQLSAERTTPHDSAWNDKYTGDVPEELELDIDDDRLTWFICMPGVIPDAFTSASPPRPHYRVRWYVVQPRYEGCEGVTRRMGEPDGVSSIDIVSDLSLGEAEGVTRTLQMSLDGHRDTLRSIMEDVAAKLAGANPSSAAIPVESVRDQKRRIEQRRACEQMLAELQVLDACRQRVALHASGRQASWRRVWHEFHCDGFGLLHAAAALGCVDLMRQMRTLGAITARASRYGTPIELCMRLRGAMWDRRYLRDFRGFRAAATAATTPRQSSPTVVAGSRPAAGAAGASGSTQ